MIIKDVTIAEYTNLRVRLLSAALNTMLVVDAVSITIAIVILGGNSLEHRNLLATLFAVAALTGAVLFSLARRYIKSVTYRFKNIESDELQTISNIAKRFYLPFMICLLTNIFLAFCGGLVLAILIFS